MSILIDKLPTNVEIEGENHDINSDFRTSILFTQLVEDELIEEKEKIPLILNLFYPVWPKRTDKAIEKIMWFYRCGKEIRSVKGKKCNNNGEKILDYEIDDTYIYSAFISQYKIDLQDIEYLHWWKFKALLEGLNKDNKICEIMKYRSIDLNSIKDKEERKFYKQMKDIYSIGISGEDLELLNEWNEKLK